MKYTISIKYYESLEWFSKSNTDFRLLESLAHTSQPILCHCCSIHRRQCGHREVRLHYDALYMWEKG